MSLKVIGNQIAAVVQNRDGVLLRRHTGSDMPEEGEVSVYDIPYTHTSNRGFRPSDWERLEKQTHLKLLQHQKIGELVISELGGTVDLRAAQVGNLPMITYSVKGEWLYVPLGPNWRFSRQFGMVALGPVATGFTEQAIYNDAFELQF